MSEEQDGAKVHVDLNPNDLDQCCIAFCDSIRRAVEKLDLPIDGMAVLIRSSDGDHRMTAESGTREFIDLVTQMIKLIPGAQDDDPVPDENVH